MLHQKGVCHAAYYEMTQVERAGRFSIVILLCTLFLAISNFIFSFMLQKSIDSALQGKLDTFFEAGSIFLIASVLYGVCFYFCNQYKEKLRQATAQQLKVRLLEHYLSLSMKEIATSKQGEVLTIITEDADKLAGFVCDIVIPFLQLILTVSVGAVYVAWYSWQMLITVTLCSIVFYFVNSRLLRRIHSSFAKLQDLTECQKDFWVDWHGNVAVIKIFSMSAALNTIYEKLFSQKKDAAIRHSVNKAKGKACSEGTILAIEFLVLLIGVFLVRTASLTLGALIGVWNASIGTFVYPMMDIPDIIAQYAETNASYQRIRMFLDKEQEKHVDDCANDSFTEPQLIAQHVSFQYHEDQQILHDVNFLVQKGDIVEIKGESGAGKSTLIKLLLQMFNPQQGEIFLRDATTGQKSQNLREHIAYVPQGNSLFNATLAENLLMQTDLPTTEQQVQIQSLCKELGLEQHINALPEKFQTVIGDDTDFSVGQAQRLAIIRAALRKCDFILLDEPFSALDSQNVEVVTQLLNRLRKNKGLLVVTHRDVPGLCVTKKLYLERGDLHESKA